MCRTSLHPSRSSSITRSIPSNGRPAHLGITHHTRSSIRTQDSYSPSSSSIILGSSESETYLEIHQHLGLVLGKDLHRHAEPLGRPSILTSAATMAMMGWRSRKPERHAAFSSSGIRPCLSHQRRRGALLNFQQRLNYMPCQLGVEDGIFIRQLLAEIQASTHACLSSGRPLPSVTVRTDSTSATSLVQKMGLNHRSKHIELRFFYGCKNIIKWSHQGQKGFFSR